MSQTDPIQEAFDVLYAHRFQLGKYVDENGRVPPQIHDILVQLTPMPFVDGVLIRRQNGKLQMGVIRRNTHDGKGRYAFIGGKIGLGKSVGESLRYHFKQDLGVEVKLVARLNWGTPLEVVQYLPFDREDPPGELSGRDPKKHSIGQLYVLQLISSESQIKFGTKTNDVGIEAEGFAWINQEEAADAAKWAYPAQSEALSRHWGMFKYWVW